MKPKFVIATAHSGRPIPCDWHIQMSSLQYPTNTTHRKLHRKGLPQDIALNEMTEEALRLGAEYILTVDDDTQIPPGTIVELIRAIETSSTDLFMACGGIYTTKTNPPEPIVYQGFGQGAYWNWRLGEIFPCWAVGNGCLMIRMALFEMMPRPWYKWIRSYDELLEFPDLFGDMISEVPSSVSISPDIFFFTRLAQMGFKVLAHGGVLPIHWDVTTGKFYWMPKDSPPTAGISFNGRPFGWTEELCRQQ